MLLLKKKIDNRSIYSNIKTDERRGLHIQVRRLLNLFILLNYVSIEFKTFGLKF